MAMNYHPEIGGHIAYRAWGMPVPLHVALSYVLYFGAPCYLWLRAIERGRSVRAWWGLAALLGTLVALPDFAAVSSGVWTYYGHQPFVVFQFPIAFVFCNLGVIFAFAAVVHLCLSHFSGKERLLTILIAPIGLAMAWAGVCLPVAAALHSDAGPIQTAIAAIATIVVSLVMTHLCIQYFRSVAGIRIISLAPLEETMGASALAHKPAR